MEIIYIVTSLLAGLVIGYLIRYIYGISHLRSSELRAKEIVTEAEKFNDNAKKELEKLDQSLQFEKDKLESEKQSFQERRRELQSSEQRILKKEEGIEKKESFLSKREETIFTKEKVLDDKEKEVESELARIKTELEKIAGINREEAKNLLLTEVKEEVEKDYFEIIRKKEEEARATADRVVKEIIVSAIQRTASEVTSEASISTVSLPSDDMKGRIIGREGRNIRALETRTEVDIIIDDTPEAIVLSCFDPIRREIARIAIEKLITDGRIQPSRIEEIVEKVKTEIDEVIRTEGEEACYELGIQGMAPELKKYVGRLKYRTSYGQNILAHSKEVSHIAGLIAAELDLNKDICKRAGLLHDIGKGVIEEDKGHAITGAELAKRFGENDTVVNAILSHHFDEQPLSLEAIVVQIADSISASRPGARRDSFDSYIRRLENLENIALSFKKVEKTYAIQAGRELRVLVNSIETTDEESKILARDIAKKIESELRYPGQIKVTVVRESRITEYAK